MAKLVSVTALNHYIKQIFDYDDNLSSLSVKGEIANFRPNKMGHWYFTLKDEKSQLKVVMFQKDAQKVLADFKPCDGTKVVVNGCVKVYEPSGEYQFYASSMKQDGVGNLFLELEKLRRKLFAEGLFDKSHKVPLPVFPKRIGVITSATGAAFQDIKNVIKRRFPIAEIVLYPAIVQGKETIDSLISGLDYFEAKKNVDVVIIGRGGGSQLDLWEFNSEKLIRRVYDFSIPIISGTGHQIDHCLIDDVCDAFGPTPSAAAELAVPDIISLQTTVSKAFDKVEYAMTHLLEERQISLNRLVDHSNLMDTTRLTSKWEDNISHLFERVQTGFERNISQMERDFMVLATQIDANNPLAILTRGYSVIEKDGAVVKSTVDVKANDLVDIQFIDGVVKASIIS